MINFVKKYVPHETGWIGILLLGIIVLMPFSVRYVFDSSLNFQTGAYSDFTSISLYLSDFIITPLLLLAIFKHGRGLFTTWYLLIIIWLIIELFATKSAGLGSYISFRLAAVILLSFVISRVNISTLMSKIAWFFAILGGVQSLIAIYQFIAQKSLGLYILGESHLSPETIGVAKIVAHGTKYIRGYGTFPHANLLAAFLVVAILFNLYLLTKNYLTRLNVVLLFMLVLNIFGLFITFSRAGIIAGIGSIVMFCVVLLIHRHYHVLAKVIFASSLGILLSLGLLWPFLATRATVSDSSTKERAYYNEIGIKIIKQNWLIGVGPGLSVLHMEQYSGTDLQPWEIQPIHNYYLITFAEWGIGGLILLLLIIKPILEILKETIKKISRKSQDDYWAIMLSLAGLSILFLFLLDHYFYTIWPTQLLLWLIIGLIMNTNRARTNEFTA